MAESFPCPACGKKLKLKDEASAKTIRCPDCSASVSVSSEAGDEHVRTRRGKGRSGKSKLGKRGAALLRQLAVALIAAIVVAILGAGLHFGSKAFVNVAVQMHAPEDLSNGWKLFKHPVGAVQIEFPTAPKFNAAESNDGARTYSVIEKEYQMSFSFKPFSYVKQQALKQDSAETFKTMKAIRTEAESSPGKSVVSSTAFQHGNARGWEFGLKPLQGTHSNKVRYVIFPEGVVRLEYTRLADAASELDGQHFLDSLRGPDGTRVFDQPTPAVPSGNSEPEAEKPNVGAEQ